MSKIVKAVGVFFLAIVFVYSCGKSKSSHSFDRPENLPDFVVPICGSAQILGVQSDPVRNGSCGIDNPVKVYAVSGVKLSTPALVNCTTATQLDAWTRSSVIPQAAEVGKSVETINVAASYACRTRNHRPGARLSEHAFGNAIDISGFQFTDGTNADLLRDYRSSEFSSFLRSVNSGACGPFGTVLGPGSDGYHEDHFHFDVARYPSGPYCR